MEGYFIFRMMGKGKESLYAESFQRFSGLA